MNERELLEALKETVQNNTVASSAARTKLLKQYSLLKGWRTQDYNKILFLLNAEHPNWRGYTVDMTWVDLGHGNCKKNKETV